MDTYGYRLIDCDWVPSLFLLDLGEDRSSSRGRANEVYDVWSGELGIAEIAWRDAQPRREVFEPIAP